MLPPRRTLAYSTDGPGEPIVSPRSDGAPGIEIDIPPQVQRGRDVHFVARRSVGTPGIEIDIPPQVQRWRAHWPPRTVAGWLSLLFPAIGAAAPIVGVW